MQTHNQIEQRQVLVRLPAHDARTVRILAAQRDMSMSRFVAQVLAEYLRQQAGQVQGVSDAPIVA